jgi:hypothetical protein
VLECRSWLGLWRRCYDLQDCGEVAVGTMTWMPGFQRLLDFGTAEDLSGFAHWASMNRVALRLGDTEGAALAWAYGSKSHFPDSMFLGLVAVRMAQLLQAPLRVCLERGVAGPELRRLEELAVYPSADLGGSCARTWRRVQRRKVLQPYVVLGVLGYACLFALMGAAGGGLVGACTAFLWAYLFAMIGLSGLYIVQTKFVFLGSLRLALFARPDWADPEGIAVLRGWVLAGVSLGILVLLPAYSLLQLVLRATHGR